ncbi:MAG: hypothetical protein C0598_10195 [Marinilabiliales bacterium]|nr:MAG: hypothetical protein C0598_10195 [Marinilabiliales bacterium]
MKKLICSLILVFAGLSIFSQQQSQYTQYVFNKSNINPAYVGSANAICVFGTARQQWMGFKDENGATIGPRDFLVNVEMPLFSIKSGAGISVESDKLGPVNNLSVRLNYAFHHLINTKHKISYGLGVELLNRTIDFSNLYYFDNGDPLLKSNKKESAMFVDLNFGINYSLNDNFYVGISGTRLLGNSNEIGGVEYNNSRGFFLLTGYDFILNSNKKKSLILSTGVLAKTTFSVSQVEAHAIVRYLDRYWAGINYRLDDAVCLMAGVRLYDFDIGVSYDYTTSRLSKAGSYGSPEIFIRYCYPISQKIKKRGYYNPRFL